MGLLFRKSRGCRRWDVGWLPQACGREQWGQCAAERPSSCQKGPARGFQHVSIPPLGYNYTGEQRALQTCPLPPSTAPGGCVHAHVSALGRVQGDGDHAPVQRQPGRAGDPGQRCGDKPWVRPQIPWEPWPGGWGAPLLEPRSRLCTPGQKANQQILPCLLSTDPTLVVVNLVVR